MRPPYLRRRPLKFKEAFSPRCLQKGQLAPHNDGSRQCKLYACPPPGPETCLARSFLFVQPDDPKLKQNDQILGVTTISGRNGKDRKDQQPRQKQPPNERYQADYPKQDNRQNPNNKGELNLISGGSGRDKKEQRPRQTQPPK